MQYIKIKARNKLEKLGYKLINFSRKIYSYPQEERVKNWFNDHGDQILRLEYKLDNNSVVIDLGGYEGQWSSDIFSRYCPFIHVFEPVEEFANKITHRFKHNPKIYVYQFGLSNLTETKSIYIQNDGSSIFRGEGIAESIKLKTAIDFFKEKNIDFIELIKINIEGGEYDLLEHLIEHNFVKNIQNIQVQFHDFIPNAETRMREIQTKLSHTHQLTWQYPFVWENWQLKV